MTTTNDKADPGTGWLDGVLVLAVLGLAGLLGCAVIRNSDIWMHLATGRLIANGQYQIGVDPFCYTTASDVWINHAWGFDIGLYHVFQLFGGAGLVLLRCGIVVITALVLLNTRRPGAGFAAPAMVTALALIAANGRLPIMQPMVVSMMALAVLMWLLNSGPRWRRRWLLPLAVAMLQVYWVNHDAWFFLGPCVIGLWIVGSLLQPRGEDDPPTKYWLGVLACALVGCLANPHHVHAFVIPDELAPTFFDPSISNQPYFRSLHLSPLDADFRRSQPAPTYAGLALLSLGVVSFALAVSAKPWQRFLVGLALAGLALWRARLIPFFAIGAAPLIVLNFQDWLAQLEPSPNRRLVGVAIRSVGALAVIGLGFAAWPGWLGPLPNNPLRAFRMGLSMESDQGLEQFARHLNELQSSGALTPSERAYCPANPANDVANYLTWFAPSLKSFIDSRWRLHAGHVVDFLSARQFFTDLDNGEKANLAKVIKTLKPYDVSLIVINGSERGDGIGPGRVLITDHERWPLIAMIGKATAFSWDSSSKTPRQTIDVPKLAFAPQAARHLPPPPDDEPRSQSMWEIYANGMRKKPMELDEAAAWSEYTDASQVRMTAGMTASAVAAFVARPAGDAAWPWRSMMHFHPATAHSPSRVIAPDRFAGAVLAVRHARAALAGQHDNAEAAFRLAQAYARLASVESLLALQITAALTQGQARLEIMAANGWDESQLAFAIANDLAARHYQMNHFDLFVQNYKAAFDGMRRPAVVQRYADQKAYEADYTNRKKQMEGLEKNLAAQRDKLEQGAGKAPTVRMIEAERLGLPGEALSIFIRAVEEQPDQLTVRDRAYAVGLMLRIGRAEEARAILHSPMFEPVTAVEPELQPIVRRLKLEAAAACGDYQRARDELSALLDLTRLGQAHVQRAAAIALASGGIALDPVAAPFYSRSFLALWWTAPFRDALSLNNQRFELLAWQGLLALEEGDTRNAKRAIDEALEELPPGARPAGWEQLMLYKTMLDRAAQTGP